MTLPFEIAPLSTAHARAAHGLTRAVGWTHRHEDWLFALSFGRGLGAFDADGALRGALMWFPYGEGFGTIGMVAVDPSVHRGGMGRALMTRALADAAGRSLQLISTEAGRRLYESLGFVVIGENAAHIGTAVDPGIAGMIEPAGADDLPALVALDTAALGYAREALLRALADAGEIVVLRRDGGIVGFSICRLFGNGHVVGPVIARDNEEARRLIAFWLRQRAGQILRVDVPKEHAAIAVWLNDLGLARGGESPIMVLGPPPAPIGPSQRFALVSQAMG
ncbi:MAG: GNAT family N-acetyltransferase [Reyranellaceae bacterium]